MHIQKHNIRQTVCLLLVGGEGVGVVLGIGVVLAGCIYCLIGIAWGVWRFIKKNTIGTNDS